MAPRNAGNGQTLVRLGSGDADFRLICFPYAGGSAAVFHAWPSVIGPLAEVHAVQLPGRAGRLSELPLRTWPELVRYVSRAVASLWDRPCAMFGHSLGAVLAFEVARTLQAAGLPHLRSLMVSGRRAPQVPDEDPPMHAASDDAFVEHVRGLNGTPAEILDDPELLRLILPALRADFALSETYEWHPGPRLACPIVVFGGTEDEESAVGRLDGWRAHTVTSSAIHMLEGGHFFLQSQQRRLLELVTAELRRAAARSPQSLGASVEER
jgi:medium-chain acyl-[acyl-carrier-protein] hydrolase